MALTFYSFGRLYGPEAGVALLVSLFALKYLEVVRQRDAYVVVVLGYFVCATALLFAMTPLMFAYVTAVHDDADSLPGWHQPQRYPSQSFPPSGDGPAPWYCRPSP